MRLGQPGCAPDPSTIPAPIEARPPPHSSSLFFEHHPNKRFPRLLEGYTRTRLEFIEAPFKQAQMDRLSAEAIRAQKRRGNPAAAVTTAYSAPP